MSDVSSPAIRLEIREHVAHLTLTRADAANTMNLAIGREFLAAAFAIRKNSDVRAVLLRGEGKNFCFGGDLRGMMAAGGDASAYLTELTTDAARRFAASGARECPRRRRRPGHGGRSGSGARARGGSRDCRPEREIHAGLYGRRLTPDAGGTFLLPRAVGYKRAMELFITNRVLDARTGARVGTRSIRSSRMRSSPTPLPHWSARLAAGPAGAFGMRQAPLGGGRTRFGGAACARETVRSPRAPRRRRAERASQRSSRSARRNSPDRAVLLRPTRA